MCCDTICRLFGRVYTTDNSPSSRFHNIRRSFSKDIITKSKQVNIHCVCVTFFGAASDDRERWKEDASLLALRGRHNHKSLLPCVMVMITLHSLSLALCTLPRRVLVYLPVKTHTHLPLLISCAHNGNYRTFAGFKRSF